MKLVMTLLARDEADIVAANLDYHFAQGVDFVIATDHSSRDGTDDVLRRYEREGLLLLRKAGGEAHDQVTQVNAMARAAAVDHGADWVINNDADEFWWPLFGKLKDVLGCVPDEFGALVAQRSNFLPCASGTDQLLEHMVVRETASENGVGEPLEPKLIHRATPEIEMAPGNHAIAAPKLAVAPDLGLLEVLHFPMRTFAQFERKVLNVGLGYERLGSRDPEVGRDQLALLELHRKGRLRAYFEDLVVDEADLEGAIASGRLVVDTRLRDFQAALDSSGTDRRAPDAAGIQKMVSGALRLATELERRSADLAQAGSWLKEARAELSRSRDELDASHAKLERAERRLASTDATLRTLQTSRLMRYSRPLRRVLYRLRGQT